jgi:hypothetical protein
LTPVELSARFSLWPFGLLSRPEAPEVRMSRFALSAIVLCLPFAVSAWQKPAPDPVKPSFAGEWQLDSAKSKSETKDLVWKIDHKTDEKAPEIFIEEIAAGKAVCSAKCPIGKSCEFEEGGKKMSAMTYYLDKSLVQTRSAPDNSTVVKRRLQLEDDGSLRVELITIVPADKTELLVFTKKH